MYRVSCNSRPSVVRDAHVDHLHGGKFLQRTARGEPRCERHELPAERDVQAVREEGDKHMRLDAVRFLTEDWADRQVALKGAERLFDLHELQIVVPQLHRIGLGQIGAQAIAAFAAANLFELLAIEAIAEPGTVFIDFHINEPPRRGDLALGAAELHQQRIARQLHILQLPEPRP